jgi:hypothetical protein
MLGVSIDRCSNLAEPLPAQLTSVRELIALIPAPGGHHRQHEDPTFAQQVLIEAQKMLADLNGCMSKVDFEMQNLFRDRCHSGEHVTRQQTHGELVGVVEDDRVVTCQVK